MREPGYDLTRYPSVSCRLRIVLAVALFCSACARTPSRIDPAVLAASAPETEQAAIARLMHISSTMQQARFEPGNRVTLLRDGPATYAAMIAAIGSAQRRVDMESYQFDTEGAQLFAPLLARRAREGIEVHLVYDAWGSVSQDKKLFDELRAAGVLVTVYNPTAKLDLDHRDHRKLLVIDNRLAITGGINITGAYLNRDSVSTTDTSKMRWRDTDVQIEGPAAAQFEALFVKTWNDQHGAPLPPEPPPPLSMPGDAIVQAIDGAPADGHPVIYETIVAAIALAKHSIHLTTGFFGPPPQVIDALVDAARRGVDVALILPAHSDSGASLAAGRSHYAALLEAGVKLYERQGVVLHAKTGVIDGLWSVVGSSNLDWRSTILNNEIDAVVVGRAFGTDMERLFADDVAASQQITPDGWSRRGVGERFDELWSRVIEREL